MYYFSFYIQDELFNSKKILKKPPNVASVPSKNLQLAGIGIAIDILSKL